MRDRQLDLQNGAEFIRRILSDAKVVKAYRINSPAPLFGAVHAHPDIHHISYVVAGHSKAKIGEKTFSVAPGDIFFIKAGDPHCSLPEFESSRLELMEVRFRFPDNEPDCQSMAQKVSWRAEIQNAFYHLINEFYMERVYKESILRAYLAELMVMIIRMEGEHPGHRGITARTHPLVLKNKLDKAVGFIQRNYTAAITLKDIAAAAHMSMSHLEHNFRDHLGVSPVNYLIQLRLNHALHLMETTDLKLAAVAEQVGIANPYYFSRLFKKHYRLAPRAYISTVYRRQNSAK